MARTEGPFIIGQPGGPSGPFYSLVNGQGRVVAMQIPNKDDAVALSANPDLLAACEALALLADSLTEDEWLCYMPHGTEFQRALPLVRAAVAKAKGEAP